MRTLTISKDSLYIRWFLWIWKANPEKLNICKLFWGTLLFPMAFLSTGNLVFFIPCSTLFWWVAAIAVIVALDWRFAGGLWFGLGTASLLLSYLTWRKKRGSKEGPEEEDRMLSQVTEGGSAAVSLIHRFPKPNFFLIRWAGILGKSLLGGLTWLVAQAFGLVCWALRPVGGVLERVEFGDSIGDFLEVISGYVEAVKKRYCFSVILK